MASEESPLLNSTNDPIVLKHELVYQRFSPSRKNFVLVLICLAGITPCESFTGPRDQDLRSHCGCSVRIWNFYTFHSSDRKGLGLDRSGYQVHQLLRPLLTETHPPSVSP